MKRVPLFFSMILIISAFVVGCEESHLAPKAQEDAAFIDLHNPDNDPYWTAIVAGQPDSCRGRIGNFVWADHDCDGYQDCHLGNPPEYGLAGVELVLMDASTGDTLATTFTDSLGKYWFGRLCYGEYLVGIIVPEGYVLSPAYAVEDTMKDSNPNPSLVVLDERSGVNKSIDFGLCERTGGDEGCTPGYWKQKHHFDSWPEEYTPDMSFSDVFEDAFPGATMGDRPAFIGMTLEEVLWLGGGGLDALGRHTVAALLNGASDNVDYPLTDDEVIGMFNDIFPGTEDEYEALKDEFNFYNELGCPLN